MKNSKIPRSNPFELLANNIFILKYAYIYIYPYAIHKERVLLWKTQSLKMRWDLVCSCTNQWHFSPPERAEPTTIQVSSEHHLSDILLQRWGTSLRWLCWKLKKEEKAEERSTAPGSDDSLRPSGAWRSDFKSKFPKRAQRTLLQMSRRENDGHSEYVACRGSAHAEAALSDGSCSHYAQLSRFLSLLRGRNSGAVGLSLQV